MFQVKSVILWYLKLGIFFLPLQIYGQAGKHGAKIVSSNIIVNEYTQLTGNAAIGNTSINVASSNLNSAGLFNSALSPGDLILIIQMQGAQISSPDDSTYGSILNYGTCGNYELVQVASVPSATVINLSCSLQKDFSSTGRTQIVRVPRYSSLTINSTGVLTCPVWNGGAGGVLAVEVQGNTVINSGGSIDVSGKGFRGGALVDNSAWWGVGNYVSTLNDYGAEKGEGIAGYQIDYDAMGGRYSKGAPANGGGGANSHNGGGGGGANAGSVSSWTGRGNPNVANASWISAWNLEYSGFASSTSSGGGKGGYTFSATNQNAITTGPSNSAWGGDQRAEQGGRGGRPLNYSLGKIFLGGGGGSGDQNNSAGGTGGTGGGIAYLLAYGDVSGTGSIRANGNNGASTIGTNGTDGSGGGGAGGVVMVPALGTISGISISANGGSGGSQSVGIGTLEAEGPGGGGGGGYIGVSNGAITKSAAGGQNGVTNSFSLSEFPPNGATKGGSGISSAILPVFKIVVVSPQTVCAGSTATLSFSTIGTPPAGTNLGWYSSSVGGVLLGSGTTFTTPVLTGSVIVYVGSCPGVYRQPVVLNADQVSSSFTSTTVCQGTATVFSATASSSMGTITGWSWDFGDGSGSSSSQNPSYTYTLAGSFTARLTATDNLGCTSVTTNAVVVNPRPGINISASPASGCLPMNVQFANTSTNANNYTWNFGDGSATSSQTNPSHVYTATGNYSVTLTASNALGCTNSKTVTNMIQASASPRSVFSASSNSVCLGDTVRFTDASIPNGTTIISRSWNFGDGSPASVQTNPSHAYMAAGTYVVRLTVSSSACSHDTTITILVNPGPVVSFNSSVNVGCNPLAVSFTNTTSGAPTYSWNFGDGSLASTAVSPTHTYLNSGTYSVTLIATQGSCADTVRVQSMIVVYPKPVASFNASSSVCLGDTVFFSNNSTSNGGITGYSWDFGDGTGIVTQSSPYHVYGSAGSYQVTLRCSTNQCVDDTIKTVFVSPAPQAAFSVSTSTVCHPASIQFNNTTSGNPAYSWNFGDGSAPSMIPSPSHVYSAPGTYSVSLIATQGSCADTLNMPSLITILPSPLADFSFTNLCINDSVSFTNLTQSQGSTIISYAWNFGDGTAVSTLQNVKHTYVNAGTYSVSLLVQSSNGCSDTIIKSVSVLARPQISFSPDVSSGCDSLTVQFNNTTTGASLYTWTFGDGGGSSLASPSHTFTSPGNYTVLLTAEAIGSCSSSRAYVNLITVHGTPLVQFSSNLTTICPGECISFQDMSSSGVNSWSWSFPGANPSSAANNAPSAVCYPTEGVFDVSLTVTDGFCSSTKTLSGLIHVVDCSTVPVAAFISSDSSVCGGTCLTFVSLSLNATSWNWSFPGATPSFSALESPQNICYQAQGSYPVTLIASNATGSDTLQLSNMIHVFPAATQPSINQNGDSLFSSSSFSYQWYLNGIAISGATSQLFIAPLSGNYTVETVDINGCSALSNSLFVSLVGIDEETRASYLLLFPVPCLDELQVYFYTHHQGFLTLKVMDALGKQVLSQDENSVFGENRFLIKTGTLAAGVYLLQIHFSDKVIVRRIAHQ